MSLFLKLNLFGDLCFEVEDKVEWVSGFYLRVCVCVLSHFSGVQLCATLQTVTQQASLVYGILQARTLEWVAMLSSRRSSWPRDRTCISSIAGRFFTAKSLGKPDLRLYCCCLFAKSCLTLCDLLACQTPLGACPWDFPGKNTGVGSHFLFQEIYLSQGLNPGLLYVR